jgi:hypothetical protein
VFWTGIARVAGSILVHGLSATALTPARTRGRRRHKHQPTTARVPENDTVEYTVDSTWTREQLERTGARDGGVLFAVGLVSYGR